MPRPMEGEEGQPQGVQHTGHAELVEVRHQEVAHPGHGARQGQPEGHQQQDHDEEGRHHPAQGALHPCCTPPCTNHQVRPANSRWVSTGQSGSPT